MPHIHQGPLYSCLCFILAQITPLIVKGLPRLDIYTRASFLRLFTQLGPFQTPLRVLMPEMPKQKRTRQISKVAFADQTRASIVGTISKIQFCSTPRHCLADMECLTEDFNRASVPGIDGATSLSRIASAAAKMKTITERYAQCAQGSQSNTSKPSSRSTDDSSNIYGERGPTPSYSIRSSVTAWVEAIDTSKQRQETSIDIQTRASRLAESWGELKEEFCRCLSAWVNYHWSHFLQAPSPGVVETGNKPRNQQVWDQKWDKLTEAMERWLQELERS